MNQMSEGSSPPLWLAPLRRGIVAVALLSLAAITLQERGASLMYATPWRNVYWLAVGAPGLLLALHLLAAPQKLRLPSRAWLLLTALATLVLLATGGLSPYRGPVLLWSCLPLSGIAAFLLMHDWLHESPANPRRLNLALTISGASTMIAALGYWFVDLTQLTVADFFSTRLFEMRLPHPLGHANYTAGLALLSLPWLGAATKNAPARWRWVAVTMTGVTLLVLFMSGSRGGLLGLGALGVAAGATAQPTWRQVCRWGILAGLGLLLLAFANPRVRGFFSRNSEGTAPNVSTVQRQAMLKAGWQMGADRPFTGWGLHSTPLVYPRYRAGLAGGADTVLQLHSTPVEIWGGLGVPGIALLGGLLALIARDRKRATLATVTVAGYAFFSLTDYQLDVPVFVLVVAALAALIARPGRGDDPVGRRWPVGLFLVIILLILAWGARADPTPEWNAEALATARTPQGAAAAITLLQRSVAADPLQELPHFNLGWLLLISDPIAAESHFRAALQLVPDKGGGYFGLGLALLNQGRAKESARALALECINDPRFIASPWWSEAAIGAQSPAARIEFTQMLNVLHHELPPGSWEAEQARQLQGLEAAVGAVSGRTEVAYRRERIGYAVLMRNQDLGAVVDLYDVREDPEFPTRVPFSLPPKGWVPSPALLKLLDDAPSPSH